MQLATEAELVQNPALGAALIWAFTAEFASRANQLRGPTMPLVLPVLPMVFHYETVSSLHSRNFEGGLDLALAENRTITADLHERMRAMFPQTMRALDIGFATNLIQYNRESGEIRPTRKTNPFSTSSDEIGKMFKTASRLGYWFYAIKPERLGPLLRIRL